jgi:hypothetical protein
MIFTNLSMIYEIVGNKLENVESRKGCMYKNEDMNKVEDER